MPKESDTQIEKVRKTSGYLDDTKQELVTITDVVVKEVNTYMVDKEGKSKPNVVKESITPPISDKRRLTQSTEQRNHKHPIKQ